MEYIIGLVLVVVSGLFLYREEKEHRRIVMKLDREYKGMIEEYRNEIMENGNEDRGSVGRK